ncbi:MAG: DUF1684 domain-containing protein [Gaiellales bacterium]
MSWRRAVAALYADVRRHPDPQTAWAAWRDGRDRLFRDHPQTPLEPADAARLEGLRYFGYDPAFRVTAAVEQDSPRALELATSTGERVRFRRFARALFCLAGRECELPLFWLEGYGDGLFLPFVDATAGPLTHPGGRYLLDTVKGADLGTADGGLVLDFNFAYNPSCAYRPAWTCPLPPADSRLDMRVQAGELMHPRLRH